MKTNPSSSGTLMDPLLASSVVQFINSGRVVSCKINQDRLPYGITNGGI